MTYTEKANYMFKGLEKDGTIEVYADDQRQSEFHAKVNQDGTYSCWCKGYRNTNRETARKEHVLEYLEQIAKHMKDRHFPSGNKNSCMTA